jgi:EAL domain-containing protein (putative c-di-GMP-specific phosphodiesterase class I)
MRTGQILGVEALLRWTDPELGSISPATFIPLAEESGLIVKMGEFVLREACQQLKAWEAQGLPSVRVSVNVSPQQIFRSNVLLMVKTVLDETGVLPSSLELEMTETTLMTNAQDAARLLDSLQELGIHIAIDDFGTGYSSLSYLKKFSVDRIKIDRAFVRDIGEDGDDEIITRAVIALAKTLDVQVIAEGVETPQQRDFLLRHGCVEAQGFLYSPAVPAAALARLLEESLRLETAGAVKA